MILDKIVKSTEERLKNKKSNLSLEDLKDNVINMENTVNFNNNVSKKDNSFEKALKNENLEKNIISFICEVKKASPSKGIICNDFDYLKIAKEYESGGAAAISVLTEPNFFKGEDYYLSDIAKEVNMPIIRKDFIIDEYMIYEAKLLGASAVLLITSILDKDKLKYLINLSYSLNLSPLVEVHTPEEIKIAIDAGAKIIGVNNRNLKDFSVNIENTIKLQKYIPKNLRKGVIFVSESGIKTPEDIKLLNDNYVDAVLIGESLMKNNDKKLAIDNLKSLI